MRGRLLAFPKDGNIYTERLYAEVEKCGIRVLEGVWSTAWLRRNVGPGDVLHIHWPSFLYHEPRSRLRTAVRLARMHLLLSMAKRRGARIVWTAHNLYPHDAGGDLAAHRLGRKIIARFADRVCVHGAAAGALVGREFGIAQSRLRFGHHPHWIDCYANSRDRTGSRGALGVGEREYLYVFFGRCRPYKGLEALIEAFAAAPPPARLLIVGNFASPAYLASISALARPVPGVEIVPRSIPDADIQLYLNAADCVVLPYRAVLTSGAALLAMSFGRPVIAPDLGAMRDHVDADCGLLYPAEQPLGLQHAMRDVRLRSFDADLILERARRFTWPQMAGLLLDLFDGGQAKPEPGAAR